MVWKKIETLRGLVDSVESDESFDKQVNEFTKGKEVYDIRITDFNFSNDLASFTRVATIIYGG